MKYILGIDVGGTKIASGLVGERFRVSKVKTVPTSQTDLVTQILKIIGSYKGYEGIGLGMPGRVNKAGVIARLPNVPKFSAFGLKKMLHKNLEMPVSIINDAQAFTLAEALLGSGKKASKVVGVTMGTGIGSGLVENKVLSHNIKSIAYEIGHTKVQGQTLEQRMKKTNDLEFLAKKILELLAPMRPDLVIFGGGRMKYPGIKQKIDKLDKKATVSKLKNAGIIGAALALKSKV